MIIFSPKQREFFADKLADFSHLVFGGMVIGQFLSDRTFSISIAGIGFTILFICYCLAYIATKPGKRGETYGTK